MSDKQPTEQTPLPLLEEVITEKPKSLGAWLQSTFMTGVLLIMPAVVTYYLIKVIVLALDKTVASWLPAEVQPGTYLPFNIPGVGLIAATIVILALGMFARNFLGRRVVKWWDSLMSSIPGVNAIYNAVRQVTDTLANGKSSFREVVLLEYPKENCWSIGFITNKNKGVVQQTLEKNTDDKVNIVFVPTAPNPTSGFLLLVPEKDLIKVDMTVEQGLKAIVSIGMVTPTKAEAKAAVKAEKAAEKAVTAESSAPAERRKAERRKK